MKTTDDEHKWYFGSSFSRKHFLMIFSFWKQTITNNIWPRTDVIHCRNVAKNRWWTIQTIITIKTNNNLNDQSFAFLIVNVQPCSLVAEKKTEWLGALIEKPCVPVQSDGHKGPPGAVEGPSQGRKMSALLFMLHPPNSEWRRRGQNWERQVYKFGCYCCNSLYSSTISDTHLLRARRISGTFSQPPFKS